MTTKTARRPRILVAHKNAEWVDHAKTRLEQMGYKVTDCLELDWVADLMGGSQPFDLAAISSELDPAGQAAIMKMIKEGRCVTRLMLLLDELDSESMLFRGKAPILTHRISQDIHEFALAVAAQVGVPHRKPEV